MLRHLLIGLTASSALLVSAQYEDLNGITPKACKASRQCTPLEQCPEMIELHRAYKTSTGRTYTKLRTDFVENVCQLDTHVHVCCNEIPEEIPLQFNQLTFHDLAGEVQYIDENTLVITDFVYDGLGPDAFFIIGVKGSRPSAANAIPVVPKDDLARAGKKKNDYKFRELNIPILRRYNGEDVELPLPKGIRVQDIRWISVFCRDFNIDFGHVMM